MNTTTATTDNEILALAQTACEELDHSYEAWLDELRAKDLADYDAQREPDDDDSGDDCSEFDGEPEPREDHFRDDVEADADALASAGFGTDEDYGYYGGGDDW